ncbi:MAG: 16S rRNA (cytosine(1402)-N(4))-methyltransferase RsmH [Rhodospirillaceae bacterium]|nr:16S rRNA (cytosine(1402)-N(4))-methyltransferase RsmH [Rhodospirillaceae bacterium]
MSARPHIPVMLAEVLAAIAPREGGVYVDGTFGAGGYAGAILDAAPCKVFGIDRDPEAIAAGEAMKRRYDGRLDLIEGRFGDMADLLAARGVGPVDGVALDLGVSSMQLDRAERGFSFRFDGPLDMRMAKAGASAADIVNGASETELAAIIADLGEERHARRVAKAIVRARKDAPIQTTAALAEIVRHAVPASRDGIDPATRTFQALRIAVNDELGEIDRGLSGAEAVLAPGGRLAVVSFHSLEDRRVKNFLRARAGQAPRGSRHAPEAKGERIPSFEVPQRRPVGPGQAEIGANPRARSARLRTAIRTAAPAWPRDASQRRSQP